MLMLWVSAGLESGGRKFGLPPTPRSAADGRGRDESREREGWRDVEEEAGREAVVRSGSACEEREHRTWLEEKSGMGNSFQLALLVDRLEDTTARSAFFPAPILLCPLALSRYLLRTFRLPPILWSGFFFGFWVSLSLRRATAYSWKTEYRMKEMEDGIKRQVLPMPLVLAILVPRPRRAKAPNRNVLMTAVLTETLVGGDYDCCCRGCGTRKKVSAPGRSSCAGKKTLRRLFLPVPFR